MMKSKQYPNHDLQRRIEEAGFIPASFARYCRLPPYIVSNALHNKKVPAYALRIIDAYIYKARKNE